MGQRRRLREPSWRNCKSSRGFARSAGRKKHGVVHYWNRRSGCTKTASRASVQEKQEISKHTRHEPATDIVSVLFSSSAPCKSAAKQSVNAKEANQGTRAFDLADPPIVYRVIHSYSRCILSS